MAPGEAHPRPETSSTRQTSEPGFAVRAVSPPHSCRLAVLSESLRIDKWLFHARFCKTRTIAQEKAEAGRIRLNGHRVEKSSANVRIGDILTLPLAGKVIALRVLQLGERRGPATEARMLYEVLHDDQNG